MTYFEREARARRAKGHSIQEIAAALCCSIPKIEMALLGVKVVRVVDPLEDSTFLCFVQCMIQGGLIQNHRMSASSMCFDILPPQGKDSEAWAGKLAKFMQIHGFNAVVAPRWTDA